MLTLPSPGDWSVTIHSGFMTSKLTLLPVSVVAAGIQAAAQPALERGRRLFVAKGCVTCHAQEQAMSEPALNVGPALIPQKYQDSFLARVLADPGTLPARPTGERMPNLNLQPQEISALVAFINHAPTRSSR
jgi:mono/diheme cytochrome c family protein